MNKTFKDFIYEVARIVRFDQRVADSNKQTYTSTKNKQSPKRNYSTDPSILLAYDEINNIANRHHAKIDKESFMGHLSDRLGERDASVDDIVEMFHKLEKTTNFFDDLPIQNKGYEKNRRRKYGPQLLYPAKKVHVGSEITKEGGKYNIVVRSVMGRYSSGTIKKLMKWNPKPKLYYVK